jgi:hypothetical protein
MLLRTVVGAAIAAAFVAQSLGAVTFSLSKEFSGGTPPSGPAPWLEATFEDDVAGVVLTLSAHFSAPTEFVTEWDFNLDPALDPTKLSFTLQSGGPRAASISTGADAFKADGDGFFDIGFEFPTAPPSMRFDNHDVVKYLITSTQTISAGSFDFLSKGGGGTPSGLPTAAHAQGTGGGEESGWITVPEPGTLLCGLVGLLLAARPRR